MNMTWLANTDLRNSWAHHPWPHFANHQAKDRTLVILPCFGFADHGLGLPLDAEEIVGMAILKEAVARLSNVLPILILPPLRFGLAPYPNTFFGIDPETAHDLTREIASGVKTAGFQKLTFFSTSPWQKEFIDAVSRDLRVEQSLQTFIITLAGLALDFHPASTTRAQLQAIAATLLNHPIETPSRPADSSDTHFRPGNYRQPSPISLDPSLDGAALLTDAGQKLTGLLIEIDTHPALGSTHPKPPIPIPPPTLPAPQLSFPQRYRTRYLPAFSRDSLECFPNKDNTLVIIPTGAIEQHGHHLPVGVDTILGQGFLENTLPLLPTTCHVLVAPPLIYGKSNEHTGFAGTLSISAKTLRRLIIAQALQLKALGFNSIGILNTHGGNSAVIVYTLRELQTHHGLRAGMLNFPFKAPLSPQETEYGFHAGEWETSLMLALAPELVHMDRAVCEYPPSLSTAGRLRPENAPATFSWQTSDISRSGVLGDATAATLEKGQLWMRESADALAKRIMELTPPLDV